MLPFRDKNTAYTYKLKRNLKNSRFDGFPHLVHWHEIMKRMYTSKGQGCASLWITNKTEVSGE